MKDKLLDLVQLANIRENDANYRRQDQDASEWRAIAEFLREMALHLPKGLSHNDNQKVS